MYYCCPCVFGSQFSYAHVLPQTQHSQIFPWWVWKNYMWLRWSNPGKLHARPTPLPCIVYIWVPDSYLSKLIVSLGSSNLSSSPLISPMHGLVELVCLRYLQNMMSYDDHFFSTLCRVYPNIYLGFWEKCINTWDHWCFIYENSTMWIPNQSIDQFPDPIKTGKKSRVADHATTKIERIMTIFCNLLESRHSFA